jgi:hypothetical protein
MFREGLEVTEREREFLNLVFLYPTLKPHFLHEKKSIFACAGECKED